MCSFHQQLFSIKIANSGNELLERCVLGQCGRFFLSILFPHCMPCSVKITPVITSVDPVSMPLLFMFLLRKYIPLKSPLNCLIPHGLFKGCSFRVFCNMLIYMSCSFFYACLFLACTLQNVELMIICLELEQLFLSILFPVIPLVPQEESSCTSSHL